MIRKHTRHWIQTEATCRGWYIDGCEQVLNYFHWQEIWWHPRRTYFSTNVLKKNQCTIHRWMVYWYLLQLTSNIHFLPPFNCKAQIVICHMVTKELKQVKIDVKTSKKIYSSCYICLCDPTLMAYAYGKLCWLNNMNIGKN